MKSFLKKIFLRISILSNFFLRDSSARILMYHSFNLPEVFFNVKKEDFIKQIDFLLQKGYQFYSLTQLTQRMKRKESLKKIIVLTFDDGHEDFVEVVLPIIRERKIPVVLFWPCAVEHDVLNTTGGVSCKILSLSQIREVAKDPLVEICAHGSSHCELTRLQEDGVERELQESFRATLEFNKTPSFAYPRGKYNDMIVSLVQKNNFVSGCTVDEGSVSLGTPLFKLPRLSIDSQVNFFVFRVKLTTFYCLVKKWLA